ncbi:MAG: Mo-dependent nitrogenase C-terminal domain-containing protein [Cyanobacteria bacterium SBLK]|nr:Mo-dependent nitrogenase C-terminal domain-containing protein [Cyanobacteria bacterium SBLK]
MADAIRTTIKQFVFSSWSPAYVPTRKSGISPQNVRLKFKFPKISFAPLQPIKMWLDNWEVKDADFARLLCQLIPPQCPFERDVTVFGKILFHIPPMCKLNPFYDQLIGLRFRALCYLADECGEDISAYC